VLEAARPPANTRAALARVMVAALGVGVAVTAGFQTVIEPSRDLALILAAAACGIVLLVLALVRFEAFLLVTLAIRASVDWTKAPSQVSEPTSSGMMTTALALVFLGAAILWLLVQLKARGLVAPAPLVIAWSAFLGISLVSAVAADRPLESLAESGRIATAVMMLLVLQQMLRDGIRVRRVLTACYVSAVVPLAMAAYQALAGGGSTLGGVARVRGTFVHPNALGFYLVILLVMGMALVPHVTRNVRPFLLPVLWASALVIIVTYSRGSWFALILGLFVVAALQAPRLILPVLGLAAVVALIVPPVTARLLDLEAGPGVAGIRDSSLAWRFDYWSRVIDLANDSPLVGIGPKMTQYVTNEAKVVHNDFLRAYVETGVLGLTAYAGVVVALIHTARSALRRAAAGFDRGIAVGFAGCVASFLLFSVGENLMSQVVVLWYFVAFAASAIAVSRSPDRPRADVAWQEGPTDAVDPLSSSQLA
jgi:putative inorganic carbon (HCO3(-)) transporter